jgi:hypothetical protein
MLRLRPILLCLVVCISCGCAGYKLGPTNGTAAGDKTIQVGPFSNQSFQPRLGDELTAAVRRAIQLDGTYRLASHGTADVTVEGTILQYARRELSLVPEDVLSVRDFQVIAVAQIRAVENGTGKVLADQRVTGAALVRVGSDLASAERQAMPLLAEDMAKRIKDLVVDGAW